MRSSALSASAVVVDTYQEFRSYVSAFAAGLLGMLLALGRHGTGKSHIVKEMVGGKATWISGNATPYGLYCQAYEHRDRPIILDDVDGLARNPTAVRLLKELCQSDARRTVSWHSARTLQNSTVPYQFTTSSPVLIIANDWRSLSADVAALEDRGHVIVFDPPAIDVHREAAMWFWDQEVFEFIGEHLGHFSEHSLRTYKRAWELKQAQMDWRRTVLARSLSKAEVAVVLLLTAPSMSEEERVQAFVAAGHGCRATYFNVKKRLGQIERAPVMPVLGAPPVVPAAELPLDFKTFLQRRFGSLGEG